MIEGAPIVGFTGANGAGKTLIAVSEAIADMRRGRPVYSTVPITCEFGESIPLVSYSQLLDIRNATVLFDEVAAIFSSRDSMAMPSEVGLWLQALRHIGVTVRWTAPGWSRADVQLRLVTQVLVSVRGIGKKYTPGEFWPRPYAIMAAALDTASTKLDAVPETVLSRRIFIPSRLSGWGAYDTLADTPRLGNPPTGGNCPDCGGKRKPVYCTPELHSQLLLPGAVPLDAPRLRADLFDA